MPHSTRASSQSQGITPSRRAFLKMGIALGLAGPVPALAAHADPAVLAEYEARLRFHEENRNELRIPALQARDRRASIPSDARPPARREPRFRLPENPAALEGAIRSVETGERVCALTFDMCELATSTSGFDADIVLWLQDNSVPATFFMGGKWMRTHERRVREVLRDPLFEIANHAWSHGNFGLLSEARMREEILDTQCQYELIREDVLKNSGRSSLGDGFPPAPSLRFFRFPYGRSSETALRLLAEYGLEPIQWNVVAETGGNNASLQQAREVMRQVTPGSILLFHANLVPKGSFQLLRYVAEGLRRQGYRFVTVGELLALGTPLRERDGYFLKPGDNAALDTRFGPEGTGRR